MIDDIDIDRETFAMWLFEEDQQEGEIEHTVKWKKLAPADRDVYYDEARAYMAMPLDEWPCCIIRRLGYQCSNVVRDERAIGVHTLWSNR